MYQKWYQKCVHVGTFPLQNGALPNSYLMRREICEICLLIGVGINELDVDYMDIAVIILSHVPLAKQRA